MKLKLLATSILFTAAFSIQAFAGTWCTGSKGWWYDIENGSYWANGWAWIDGNNDGIAECYFFDENGWLYVSTMIGKYEVDENGAWIENGVVQL